MADIPPVSDPQLAALLDQNKKRRQRAIMIFVAVALVLGVGLGGSAFYFSGQAKKKRNVAYSRVVKCLLGKPLDSGEPPMSRIRSAWRARIVAQKTAKMGDLDTQEANDTAEWPNRCVAEMISFTDTLKEIGEMKEGDKDLGFYSRDLSKQTAGKNWQNVDTYQASIESFVAEAQKGNFEFVDVPDVKAPDVLEAEPIDKVFPKSSALEGPHVNPGTQESVAGTTVHFFLGAAMGKPTRLCATNDGKTLTCGSPVKGGLPPEASGEPWMLGSEDGAPSLLAFGLDSGITSGGSVASGVFRTGDGFRLVKAGEYYVAGGWSRADGSALLLLKEAGKPNGDKFKIGRLAPGAAAMTVADISVPEWNGEPSYIALLADRLLWVDENRVLKSKTIDATSESAIQIVATLPGTQRPWSRRFLSMMGCVTKTGLAIAVPTEADGASRALVALATPTGWGKPDVIEPGAISCGDDALYMVSRTTLSTCKVDGCKPEPLASSSGATVGIEGGVVRAEVKSGLLRISWEAGGKEKSSKLYDAQMKGTLLLGESKLKRVELIARRGYALMIAYVGDAQHFARIDPGGTVTPTGIKDE